MSEPLCCLELDLPVLPKIDSKIESTYPKKYYVKSVKVLDVNPVQKEILAQHVMVKVKCVKVELWDLHHLLQ